MLDSHLVMNVLNLMAARDFKENGREDPLLFALSDYLHQAFQLPTSGSHPVADELALLRVQLQLVAEIGGSTIELEAEAGGAGGREIGAGQIAGVAAQLARLPEWRALGKGQKHHIRLQVDVAERTPTTEGEPAALAVTLEFRALNSPDSPIAGAAGPAGAAFELVAAQRRFDRFFPGLQPTAKTPPAEWSQRDADHLRLSFLLPMA